MRQAEKGEFLKTGRAALEEATQRAGKSRAVSLRPALERFALPSEDELYDAIGRGRVRPQQVLEVLFPDLDAGEIKALGERQPIDANAAGPFVQGGNVAATTKVRLGGCCRPVPGDRIVGIKQPDKSLTVHTIDCPRLADFEDREDLWRDLRWTAEAERNALGLARVRATIRDAPGVLGEACTIIGEAGGNILNLNMHHRQSAYFDVDFDVEVKDNRHLTNIMAALRACPSVDTADRAMG